jgi:hypothetical protein
MPNWVCTRDYYALTASGGAHRQPFYLVPTKRYHCTAEARFERWRGLLLHAGL